MGKKRIKNTVQGTRRGRKWPESTRTGALADMLVHNDLNNLSAIARRHGVPESTLRTWYNEALKGGAQQEQSVFAKAREQAVMRIAMEGARGAQLVAGMMVRRAETGAEQAHKEMQMRERLDALMQKASEEQTEEEKRELLQLRQRMCNLRPMSDFAMANHLRALTSVSMAAAKEKSGEEGGEGSAGLEEMLAKVEGEEF